MDVVDFFIKLDSSAQSVSSAPYVLFIGPILALSVAAFFVERRGFHAAFALLFLTWIVGMTALTLGPFEAG